MEGEVREKKYECKKKKRLNLVMSYGERKKEKFSKYILMERQ